ncbi:MAG TPA: hypothetical protein PLS42_14450 [Candidatus Competibacter denitrificans]|nr:hypothetical protein [Candidatus Competibacter denitrificans]
MRTNHIQVIVVSPGHAPGLKGDDGGRIKEQGLARQDQHISVLWRI